MLITIAQAAALLGISETNTRKLAQRNILPIVAHRIDRWREALVDEEAVLAYKAKTAVNFSGSGEGLIQVSSAARQLGISRQALHKKIAALKIETFRKNQRTIFISLDDFERLKKAPKKVGRPVKKPNLS